MKQFTKRTVQFALLCLTAVLISFNKVKETKVDADKIMEKVQNTILGHSDYKTDVEMILTRGNGKSYTRQMVSFNKEVNREKEYSLMKFNTPKDVKGMKSLIHSFMSKSDDQWIYIPGINATKRIANENKSGAFMGSEFANEDLGIMNLFKYKFEYLESKSFNGKECHVIRSYPINKYSGYKYVDIHVTKDGFLPAFLKYYNRKGQYFKNQEIVWEQFKGGSWLLTTAKVINVKNKRTTTLKRSNFQFDVAFEASFFDSENIANVE
ncbi:outer membrane lipoprotein-sorting protein [Pseudofulvibacter geojedonensis]|uniref:Outer membrane lipoprotein-sorting protein n=1 Tax=Pseudofulvibacter geojedonensis TaxID=1123758 RepID=A0ABW3HZS7_9FLAO